MRCFQELFLGLSRLSLILLKEAPRTEQERQKLESRPLKE